MSHDHSSLGRVASSSGGGGPGAPHDNPVPNPPEASAAGRRSPAAPTTPCTPWRSPRCPSVERQSPSILLSAPFQFDPQDLRDFFLEFNERLGPFGARLKPRGLLLQRRDLRRQRVLLLGDRPPFPGGERRQISLLPLPSPSHQIGRMQPLTPHQCG